jgi:hypothetical protein
MLMARTLSVNLMGPVRSAMVTANGFYDSIVHVELHPGTHRQRMCQLSADLTRRLEGAGAVDVAVRQQTAPRNRVFFAAEAQQAGPQLTSAVSAGPV